MGKTRVMLAYKEPKRKPAPKAVAWMLVLLLMCLQTRFHARFLHRERDRVCVS